MIGPALHDDEDSVRLLLPPTLSVISGKLSDAERQAIVLTFSKNVFKDGSWRVRSSFANEIPTITQPFGIAVIKDEFCPLLFRLLHDPEAETKTAACKAMSGVLKLLTSEKEFVFEKFIPEIEPLTYDGAPQVRREIALHLMELAAIIGKEHTIKSIVPILLQVLRGTDNEASVALLNSLLIHIPNIDLSSMISAILPVILELAGDTHWRVKVSIIKLIPALAKELSLEEFTRRLFPIVTSWLSDSIFSVRDTMSQQLPLLVQLFGNEWASQTLTPVIQEFKSNNSYLIRQVTLLCINKLHNTLPAALMSKLFLPTITQMATDKVANVKFLVAKTLLLFVKTGDQKSDQQVQSCLKTLSNDSDTDVKYFACTALLKCQ